MKRLLAAAVISCIGVAVPGWSAGVKENPEVAGAIRLYEAWVGEQMLYRGLPGIAVGIVVDQELVWAKGFGFADTEKRTRVTPQTLFRMASHTKLFTATAVLQLRDAGKLHLDDPVSKHLPWFRMKPAVEDDPAPRIEDLLTHSGGLPREAAAPYWITFQFPSREEVERTVAGQTAAYAPQVRWKYSNLGYTLAGRVVEAASGEAWTEYVRHHILQPLGMTASTIDQLSPALATGYGRRMPDGQRRKMPFTDTKGIAPAAGLSSNLEDMARFVSLQFRAGKAGGAQILSGHTLREMHRPRFLQADWNSGWGLGFSVTRRNGQTFVGHGGSLAGYKSNTSIDLDHKIGVIVLSNGDDTKPEQFGNQAYDIVGKAIVKAMEKSPDKVWDPKWSRYAGLYRTMWGDTQVVELNRELVVVDPLSDSPGEGVLQLKPRGNGEFILEGRAGGNPVGEPVRFEEENGRVVRMVMAQLPAERVE